MKDWEFYRRKFIAYTTDYIYTVLATVEKSTSPIERIAILECIRFRDTFGVFITRVSLQVEVGPYRADIVIENEQGTKVAVECDGHEFHEKTKEQASRDKKRDREFQKSGYVILRYSGSDIVNNPEIIFSDLRKILITPKKVEVSERIVSDE